MVHIFDESRAQRAATGGRIPPSNLEAEESLLGAMMLSRDAITAAVEARVDAGDFYKPAHGHIFRACRDLHERGEPVDPVTVAEALRRDGLLDPIGGRPVLLRIQAQTPASANAAHYAQIVHDLSLLRRLISVGNDIAEMGFSGNEDVDDTLDRAESLVFEVAEHRIGDSLTSLYPALEATMDRLEQLYDRDAQLTGVSTSYADLDRILLGLQPSNLVICAARPGAGKTSFALGTARHVAVRERRPVLFFSMEMDRLDLVRRLLSAEARIDARKLQTGQLSAQEWPKLNEAVGRLAEAPFYIDDDPRCTVMEMRAKSRRVKSQQGDLGLIVVDYLQLMTSHNRRVENRQVEVSEISRGLKILAREMQTPVLALAQLNRQVEYRNDKRPMLADLRESGCLVAETRLTRADTNEEVTLGDLVASGAHDVPVWTLDEHYRLVRGTLTKAFPSGIKATFELRLASGRSVVASSNHPFLTLSGWQPLADLQVGSRIAVARRLDGGPGSSLDDDELLLLAHLIGDGCTLSRQALRYTTTDQQNADAVAAAVRRRFGITARTRQERRGLQVFLPAPFRLTHGCRNPVAEWLDGLGAFDRRESEKRVPAPVFSGTTRQIAWFLHHLWSTGGSLHTGRGGTTTMCYATTSEQLAHDVQDLLLRLDIRARIRRVQPRRGARSYTVDISGRADQLRFLEVVGIHGERATRLPAIRVALEARGADNPNVDTVPAEVWSHVRHKVLPDLGVSARELASRLGMRYAGSTLYLHGVGRSRMSRLADALPDPWLRDLADSDVMWDRVVAIEGRGPQPVYDATVPGTHNFLANGLVAHNSLEQDADVVMFIYREDQYNQETESKGVAEIIVGKHRGGPTGVARLAFVERFTMFHDMANE